MFRGHVSFRGCWWEEILSKKRHPDAGAGVLSSSNGRVRRAVVSLQKGIFFTSMMVKASVCLVIIVINWRDCETILMGVGGNVASHPKMIYIVNLIMIVIESIHSSEFC